MADSKMNLIFYLYVNSESFGAFIQADETLNKHLAYYMKLA